LTTSFRMTCVCVIGLGYVGLPLAKLFVDSGFVVMGIDRDEHKIESIRNGSSYLTDLSNDEIAELSDSGRFSCTTDFSIVKSADVVIICVPTPWNDSTNEPDLNYIESAARSITPYLREGQLVVLESSTFPGTTEEVLAPILEESGLRAGSDIYIAYSPERIDPGSAYDTRKIPKVLGGINDFSRKVAEGIYRQVFREVVVVSSTKAAELTKLLENTQRLINISLMNELTHLAEKLRINIWEVIQAASTKPYGFTPFYPGPGIGGHCIPVDPLYLKWTAERHGLHSTLIAAAHTVNTAMPGYVVSRILKLTDKQVPNVLLIGMTYKRDVNDLRESSSLEILELLTEQGAEVSYHDPLVSQLQIKDVTYQSVSLDADTLQAFDVVAVLTNHSTVDYDLILAHAPVIFDTRQVYETRHTRVVHL
jgi:UDP-N-acetyl-D-glucosamine dehydrogenase